jgi:hypothetical protein
MLNESEPAVLHTRGAQLPDACHKTESDVSAAYDGRLFVAQTEEHSWVVAKIRQWQAQQGVGDQMRPLGAPQVDQVLRLVGEHGIGKTWLLSHLAADKEVEGVALYLDLERRHNYREPEAFANTTLAQIKLRPGRGPSVLLLDSVPLLLDPHLRALEDLVLRPQLAQHGSMVIMALSHPSRDCWRIPALRGGATRWLEPFDQGQTGAQLGKLAEAGMVRHRMEVSAMQDYSGGLPLLNYLLALWGKEQAYEYLMEHVLSRVPMDSRRQVRGYLDAVCVLEVLEHEPVEKAVRLYARRRPEGNGMPARADQVRSLLRQHWLARPSAGTPGRLVLVESVRRAAKEVFRTQDAELYVSLSESIFGTAGGQR